LSKRIIAMLLAALALVVVAGCGSSDDDEGTSEETLTKVEFIKQGDKICEEAEDRSEEEAEEFAEENGFELEKASEEQIEEAITEVLVPALNQQAEEIQALGAPEGDEERVEAIVTALEDGASEVADEPKLAFEGQPLKDASKLAKDYGFKVCGEE
jgi:hypothetical protein